MAFLQDVYFGLWAQISHLEQIDRAALVLVVFWLIVWSILIFLFPQLIKLLLAILKIVHKTLYILFSDYILPLFFRKNYISISNRFSSFMENGFKKLNQIKKKKKRKFHFGKLILLYGLSLFLIVLPELLNPVVSPEYLKAISFVSTAYNNFESKQLEIAQTHNPIFLSKQEDLIEDSSEYVEMQVTEDVYFREGPSKSYDYIKILKKDTVVYFIEKSEDGNWYYVKTEDEIEGWVHSQHIN